MNYRLLALDIDGTIRNSQRCLTKKTREAILRVQDLGVCVAIATGRTAFAARETACELELDLRGGYLISGNGAQIHACANWELIHDQALPFGFAGGISRYCEARGLSLIGFEDERLLTNHPDNYYVRFECEQDGMVMTPTYDFSQYNHASMSKFIIAADEPVLLELEPEMQRMFGSEAAIFRSEPYFMEFVNPEVNKGAGVRNIMERIGCSAEEVVACGNAYNDISMLRIAGIGVAVANAPQGVKDSADFVTGSCDEDGVAVMIEKLFF